MRPPSGYMSKVCETVLHEYAFGQYPLKRGWLSRNDGLNLKQINASCLSQTIQLSDLPRSLR